MLKCQLSVLAVLTAFAGAAPVQAAGVKPRAYIDVVDDDEFVLVVDKKVIEHSWAGFFDAAEEFKSDARAYEHMRNYNHATNMAWGVSLISLFLSAGALAAANQDSAHALPWINISFSVLGIGMYWSLNEAITAQYEFIKGINQYNGIYGSTRSHSAAAGWHLRPGMVSYTF